MSHNFKGIRFCPTCMNMMNPLEEDKILTFACRYCDFKEAVEDQNSNENLIYRRDVKGQKQGAVIEADYALDPTMSRTREVKCPLCDYNEAVYFMIADQEDRKIRKVFICGNVQNGQAVCKNFWYSDQVNQL